MGKTRLEVAIHDEARALVDHLKSFDGKPTLFPIGLRTAVLNVVWQLVAGKRYDLTSKEVDTIFDLLDTFRNEGSNLVFVEYSFPILKILPKFVKTPLFNLHILENFRVEMKKIIEVSETC